MSNIYIQEPPTQGKVLLKTSLGDVDIELWSKEAPKACRNFIQLCLEGYYDNSIFHRIIPGFIVQGGDPTGSGEGGQSIYGQAFKDEFHSRLKFSRRGLVAMANAGPNDNASQFFFTLDRCEHLDKKHTIFGKVTGHTVFNMIKLGEVETDAEDRPLYPPKIKTTEVLANPFDDIVPRENKKSKEEKGEKKKKSKSKATKNFSLLSFGEEAEEDEEETSLASEKMKNRSKSAHDLTRDRTLSSAPAIAKSPPDSKRKRSHSGGEDGAILSSPESKTSPEGILQKLKKFKEEGEVEDGEGTMEQGELPDDDEDLDGVEANVPEEIKKIEEIKPLDRIMDKVMAEKKRIESERIAKDKQKEVRVQEASRTEQEFESAKMSSDKRGGSRWDKTPDPSVQDIPDGKLDGRALSTLKDVDAKKSIADVVESSRTSEKSAKRESGEKSGAERNSKRDSRGGGDDRSSRRDRDGDRSSKRDSQEHGRGSDRGHKRDSERSDRRDRKDGSRDGSRNDRRSKTDGRETHDGSRKDSSKDAAVDSTKHRTERTKRERSRESSKSSDRTSSHKDTTRNSVESGDKRTKTDKDQEEKAKTPENGSSRKREREQSQEGGEKEQKLSRKEQIRRELESLNRELMETRRKREKRTKGDAEEVPTSKKDSPPPKDIKVKASPVKEDLKAPSPIPAKPENNEILDEFRAQKKKFKQLKKQQVKGKNDREAQTLAILAKFQKKLHRAILDKPEEKEEGEADEEDETAPGDEEEKAKDGDDERGFNWATHSLRFEADRAVLAKDANVEGADTFDIYDPRNPMNKRRREESKRKSRGDRKGRR